MSFLVGDFTRSFLHCKQELGLSKGKMGELPAVSSSSGAHIRSTSLPTSVHPLNLQLEENLNKLRNWEVLASTSSPASSPMEMLIDDLCGLGDLYQAVEVLLQLQQSQQVVEDKIWVEQELDGSLRLLDVIGIARDGLFQMREHINNIHSALRRSKMQEELENRISAFLSFKKKMKKDILKGFKEWKRAQDNSKCSPVPNTQQNPVVITGLKEARFIFLSVFQSLLVYMCKSRPITSQWSLASKWMKRGQVACEVQIEAMVDIGMLDTILPSLCSQKSHKRQESQHVQKELEHLEKEREELDEILNCVFRSLIKTRVTLLNTLSN